MNDLSLSGQFSTPTDFIEFLIAIIKIRHSNPEFKQNFFCSKSIVNSVVSQQLNFHEAVGRHNNKTEKMQIMSWLNKSGPFCETDRSEIIDDYFEYCGHDVTNQGLGEASRRQILGRLICTFSFNNCAVANCSTDPLKVQHGLPEEVYGQIDLKNFIIIEEVEKAVIASVPLPNNWIDFDDHIRSKFKQLIFSDQITKQLKPCPFNSNVRDRSIELLSVLDRIVQETNDDGSLSEAGNEILGNHFSGEKAWFSDESSRNKDDFKNDMTFRDPTKSDETIFCPWHGKIKSPQFRIHFEWPRPQNNSKIKVCYIGPKLTKR